MSGAFKKIEAAGLKEAITLRELWNKAVNEPTPDSLKELLDKLK